MAMMRGCLVSHPAPARDDAEAARLRATGLTVRRTIERLADLGLDLGLVMGSSEVCAAPSAAPPQPRPAKSWPAGQHPEAGCSRPHQHSNAPFGLECQSILSKIVAVGVSQRGKGADFDSTIRRSDPSRSSKPFRRFAGFNQGTEE